MEKNVEKLCVLMSKATQHSVVAAGDANTDKGFQNLILDLDAPEVQKTSIVKYKELNLIFLYLLSWLYVLGNDMTSTSIYFF